MKFIPMSIMFLLLFGSVYATSTTKTCSDAQTLQILTNKTITTDGVAEVLEISEEVNCPNGCVDGKCKSILTSVPINIYLFLCVFSVFMFLISFLKDDVLIFKWITVMLLFALAAMSFSVNQVFCEYSSSGWNCHVYSYSMSNLAYLWGGLGTIMLIYAFITSVTYSAKQIKA